MRWGIRNRVQFLWLCIDGAVDEIGRVTQTNRLVGWLILGSIFVGVLGGGLATVLAAVFNSYVPWLITAAIVALVVLLEGAYLEWVRIHTTASVLGVASLGPISLHVTGPVTINQYGGAAPPTDNETHTSG